MNAIKKSPADIARMEILAGLPCICCESLRVSQPWRTEIHHIVKQSYRNRHNGHQKTLNLCSFHHRSLCLDGWTYTMMERKYGPSLEREKAKFNVVFGTEQELLEQINQHRLLKENNE